MAPRSKPLHAAQTRRQHSDEERSSSRPGTFDEVVEAIDSLESEPDRHLSIQIDKSLRDAIKAAQTSGQSADVTIKIKVKPEAGRRVGFSANVSAKLPRPPVSGVTLFADIDGKVHKADPAQLKLPMATALASRVSDDN